MAALKNQYFGTLWSMIVEYQEPAQKHWYRFLSFVVAENCQLAGLVAQIARCQFDYENLDS